MKKYKNKNPDRTGRDCLGAQCRDEEGGKEGQDAEAHSLKCMGYGVRKLGLKSGLGYLSIL